jgi:SAM-dependent methyltransferase
MTRKNVYELIVKLSGLDYGEPLPKMDEMFFRIWTNHYYRIVRLLPKNKRPAAILEIGVGYGVLGVLLKRHCQCSVTVTEHPSRGYLRSSDFIQLMNAEDIRIVEHDLNQPMPFGDETFDMVFYCDVMEHLPPDLVVKNFSEIKRIMKKGGSLILSTPNLARLPNRLRFFFGRGINPPPVPAKVGETYDHIREYTQDEVEKFLRNDFRIAKCDYGLIPFFNREGNILNSLLFRLSRGFGDEIYVLAEVMKDGL